MKRDGKKKKKPFPPQDVFTQINTRRNDKKCIGEKPPVSIVLLRIRCAVAAPSFARAANLRSAAFCSASRGRRVRSWCPWTSSCRGRLGQANTDAFWQEIITIRHSPINQATRVSPLARPRLSSRRSTSPQARFAQVRTRQRKLDTASPVHLGVGSCAPV